MQISSEQNELAGVFAKLALGRRNTITGSNNSVKSNWPKQAKQFDDSQTVPSLTERSESSYSLCADEYNDSVFLKSDSLSSSMQSLNKSLADRPHDTLCDTLSLTTIMPASTASITEFDDEQNTLTSLDTLASLADDSYNYETKNAFNEPKTDKIIDDVNELNTEEVIIQIDKVIKDLDKDESLNTTLIAISSINDQETFDELKKSDHDKEDNDDG